MKLEALEPFVRVKARTMSQHIFSACSAMGADVTDAIGKKFGVVIIDLMLTRDQRNIAYVVVSWYGVGGVGPCCSDGPRKAQE